MTDIPDEGKDEGNPAGPFSVDDRVEARWKSDHGGWYRGKITKVNSDGTYAVQFDDGDFEPSEPLDWMMAELPLKVGDLVDGKWKRSNSAWYSGKITQLNSDGTYALAFDDGDFEPSEPLDWIRRSPLFTKPAQPTVDEPTVPAANDAKSCSGREVTVKRMDPNGLDGHGWGMWLEFMCGAAHVSIGSSHGSQSQSTTVYTSMLPDDCPARIDKSNWLGGHTYGDFFDVTVGDCPSDDHATGHYDVGGEWHDMAWWNTHET